MRRYPLSALVEASGLSEAALGRAVGLSGTTLVQAREVGLVESAADRYAVRAGIPTLLVWPDFGQVECAAEDCTILFAPHRKGHKYCSARCRNRVSHRIQYATNPARRAMQQAGARRYYQEAGEYVRRQSAANYAANREARMARMRVRYQERKTEAA